jgi:PIN domain nuclease of toxin-antitoxin system
MEKLRFEGGLPRLLEIIERHGIIILPIAMSYIAAVIELPFIHRDTFDRILVATAKTESLTILTADKNIPLYNVLCEW